jgi:hypothetical protein
MAYWTPEGIALKTNHLDGMANIRAINKIFRAQDESHLFPINNRFNATERAIRKARDFQKNNGPVYGLEYCYLLETIISEIVNNY